jgi:hypothetical protein
MNDERAALGITLVEIAEGAAKTSRRKRGTCSISTVSKVFAGLTKSWNVVRTYQRIRDQKLKREQGAA